MLTESQRQFDHLISDRLTKENIESYLQAIESLFKKEYLNSKHAQGPLPELWQRLDFLATNELVVLGKAIHDLKELNSDEINEWLLFTSSAIKRHSRKSGNAEGFIREIIYCGTMLGSAGEIIPAKKAKQAYDLEIKAPNVHFVVSLKKFGKSDSQKHFERHCDQVAIAIREKASYFKKNVLVKIFPNTIVDEDLGKRLRRIILNSPKLDDIEYYEDGFLIMKSAPLMHPGLKHNSGSWQLNVVVPENKNEQTRFVKKVIQEISNIKKTLDSSPEADKHALRKLYVSVNESCDMEFVTEKLIQHYKDVSPSDEIGVDIVILHKVAVCQNKIGVKGLEKTIIHDIRPINFENLASSRILSYIRNGASQSLSPLKMNPLIGAFDKIPLPVISTPDQQHEISRCYSFQKGLFIFDMVKQPGGSFTADLITVAPKGITCKVAIPEEITRGNKGDILVGGKIIAPHDDLLIL